MVHPTFYTPTKVVILKVQCLLKLCMLLVFANHELLYIILKDTGWYRTLLQLLRAYVSLSMTGKHISICDWACENRACGLKYTMSFDETYLNTEM